MRILGIDTSTLTGALALLDGERVVAETRLGIQVTHGERLLPAVDDLLRSARRTLADVDGFAVAAGPGSFTGLRIGISTVKGLAYATGRPVAGVPTLDALAWSLPFAGGLVCPVLDARKGEVYAALYRTATGRLERLDPPRAVAPETLARELAGRGEPVALVGDGVAPWSELFERVMGPGARLAPPSHRVASAVAVADLGRAALARGEGVAPAGLSPLYVRRSEAELARERRERAGAA